MSELPDSRMMTIMYCPGCEERDPTRELLEVRYCEHHAPARGGADDHRVEAYGYLSGSAEAGGEENRAWNELLCRKKTLLRGPA